ncbi:MAG: metal ABC transporter ATP-binding protein [Lentisphaerae bacterium]|nr:MAG: metal ABC transporter ATP-binding protein [Lentisphaerota bacterium]
MSGELSHQSQTSDDVIVRCEKIEVGYGEGPSVFRDCSFDIIRGQYVALAGPNGGGKSTLVKAILGLIPLRRGKVYLLGQELGRFRDWVRIGYLSQQANRTQATSVPVTVNELLNASWRSRHGGFWPARIRREERQQIQAMLELLDIQDLGGMMCHSLSGGQQQRVFLAQTMMQDPELVILDEPTEALDPKSRDRFYQLLQRLNRERAVTIILITHDIASAGHYADTLLFMDHALVYHGNFADFCRSGTMTRYFGEETQHMICHQHGVVDGCCGFKGGADNG